MFKNYFTVAVRNLKKYKLISFINLFGLTVGLTCCLMILTYILHEISFDKYNRNANRIYRVTRSFNTQDGTTTLNLGTVAPPFGPLLAHDFPAIEAVTELLPNGTTALRYKDKIFNEKNVFFADENLFKVFDVKVIKGNPQTALSDPFCVMLSDVEANKYFGGEDPLNKMILMENHFNLKVTAIYQSFPSNAHIHPELMLSFPTLSDTAIYGAENLRTNWGNNSFFTYLLMPANYPMERIAAKFPAFLDAHMNHKDYGGADPSKFTNLGLQKLTDIHLRSHMDYEAEENGDIKRVYIFSAIALFILLIACINYMNLSTARSALRSREIGIRKVVGAQKKELIFQFLSESVIISWAAILLALGLLYLILPSLNKLSGLDLSIKALLNWETLLAVFFVPFTVGIISGIYPALFMSSFQPVKTLKGLFKAGGGSISLRKALVVTQFAISIILIISTAVVFEQLRYMQESKLGYDKEHIVAMLNNPALNPGYESFRNELLQNAYIRDATRSSRIPTGRLLDGQGASSESGDSLQPVKADIRQVVVDRDFVPTFGMAMAAGRNFSRDFATDSNAFVLNETAVNIIGWKSDQEAIGKNFGYGNTKGKVVGVIKDFHFESMHQKIAPIVFIMPPDAYNYYNRISIKIAGGHVAEALAYIEKTWRKYLPETPYEYTFLDENFGKLYASEQKQGTLFTIFACIAVFIASLGLFGLSAFAITQRIRELGIRKVLGASVSSIVSLLSRDFLVLVIFAALIAFPVAWYAMHNWLADFAYHIQMPWWVFLLAGLAALSIALVTVSSLAIKAASANPVKSLRTE
jgi:putative ABC transport system permease protein